MINRNKYLWATKLAKSTLGKEYKVVTELFDFGRGYALEVECPNAERFSIRLEGYSLVRSEKSRPIYKKFICSVERFRRFLDKIKE